MSTAAYKLALKGIAYGADKIPDKLFESIPGGYYKAKQQQMQKEAQIEAQKEAQKHRSSRNRKHSDAGGRRRPHRDSDYYDRDYYDSERDNTPRNRADRRRWSSVDGRDSHSRHLDHEDSYHPRKSDRNEWAERYGYAKRDSGYASYNQPTQDLTQQYKPYNPADYAPQPAAMDHATDPVRDMPNPSDYYRPYAPENQHAPPVQEPYYYDDVTRDVPMDDYQQNYYPPQANDPYAPPPAMSTQVTRYVPHADAGAFYGNTQRPQQLIRRESRSQPVSRSGSQRSSDRGRRHRRRSVGDSRSGSPSRRSKSLHRVKDRLKNLNDDDRKLAATVTGAAGGGMLVSGISHNTFGKLLGAAIGGLAAREVEKKASEKRAASRGSKDRRKKDDRDDYDSYDDDSEYERSRHPDGRRRRRRDSF